MKNPNFFYLGPNKEKVFFNDLSISGIYVLQGLQDDADRGRVAVRTQEGLCPACWSNDNTPLVLEDLTDVVFKSELDILNLPENTMTWANPEMEMIYFFSNDKLIMSKTIKEIEKILSK